MRHRLPLFGHIPKSTGEPAQGVCEFLLPPPSLRRGGNRVTNGRGTGNCPRYPSVAAEDAGVRARRRGAGGRVVEPPEGRPVGERILVARAAGDGLAPTGAGGRRQL